MLWAINYPLGPIYLSSSSSSEFESESELEKAEDDEDEGEDEDEDGFITANDLSEPIVLGCFLDNKLALSFSAID